MQIIFCTYMRTIDRLKLFIEFKGLSYNNFDKLIGGSNGYIGKQIKNLASIGSDVIEKIISIFPDLNIIWLLTGHGDMIIDVNTPVITDNNDNQMGVQVHIPPAKNEKKIGKTAPPTAPATTELLNLEVYRTPQVISIDRRSKKENIVYVPIKAAAGYLNGFGDPTYIETLPTFNLPGLTEATYRAFEVGGDSMYPTLQNKEMVIGQWVERLDFIREDRVHIIVTKSEGVIVKRLLNRIEKYGYIVAKSDAVNDRNLYPNIHIYPDDILEVWYAVWHGGFEFKAPSDLWKRQNNLEADLTEVLRRLKAAGI